MKNSHFLIGLIGSGLILLTACEPDPIDIAIDTPQPKLVVSSQIIPNQIMIVSLTKSFSALSSETKSDSVSDDFLADVFVKDAFVTVSYFGQTDTLTMLTAGIYASISTLLYDYGFYTLKALDPATGLEVSATSTILPQVKFDTIYPAISDDSIVTMKFGFSDIPGEENYYVINYYKKVSDATGGGFDINSYFSIGSNKLLAYFELLNDKTIENHQYSKETVFSSEVGASDTIAVTLSNISKGYYDFLSAYKKSGTIFNQITGEPINYPTNVVGGYGYFNTHYPDVRIFDLNNY